MITVLISIVVLGLVWLFLTQKVTFPLLFDAGLAVATLGLIVLADGVQRDTLSAPGAWMFGGGVVLLLLSYARQTRKYDRQRQHGDPMVLDGREMHRARGGKK